MKKLVPIIIFLIFTFLTFQCLKSRGEVLITNNADFGVINNHKIIFNVADTEEKIIKGLMFIDNISENQGMVFLFNEPDYKSFWMKNMKIPLDIVFINDNKIAKIYKEVPACKKDPCPIYNSKYKVDTVVELKSGFCKKYNIKTGDIISFSQEVNAKRVKIRSGS